MQFGKFALVIVPDIQKRRAGDIIGLHEDDILITQLVFVTGPIGFRVHGHAARGLIFNPDGLVFISNIAVRIEVGFFHRIERGIMAAP